MWRQSGFLGFDLGKWENLKIEGESQEIEQVEEEEELGNEEGVEEMIIEAELPTILLSL